jgi:predicted methyltransferase
MRRSVVALASLFALVGCGSAPAAPAKAPAAEPIAEAPKETSKLEAAIADPRRPEAERARDGQRHPRETLEFFGVREDQRVIELWPGGGWYTAILAPALAERGHLTITSFDPNGPPDAYGTKSAKNLRARLDAAPEIFGKVEVVIVRPPQEIPLGDGKADVILTFRNFHNWIQGGFDDAILAASFRALKPGGTLGIVEHRAPEGADPAAAPKTGYVPESYVVARAQAAGFVLAGKSEINANPRDTKDHPEGVWTLPPVLRLGDKDREKYVAIGESDRMTLKFTKPAR